MKALYLTLCIVGMVVGGLGVGMLRGGASAGLALVLVGFPAGITFALLTRRETNKSGRF